MSNKKLLLALVALIAVVAAVLFFDSKKGTGNFKTELSKIDSAKVSTILIYPKAKKGEEVKLTKEGNGWKVKISDTKSQPVDSTKILMIINSLKDLKATRLAALNSDKWQEYEVDTSGTHIIIKEGDKTTLDIVIGKFNYSGGREMETLVRLTGDDKVYGVNGYLAMLGGGIETYRDGAVVKGNKDNWTKLTFSLGDSLRYFIEKRDSLWLIDGTAMANETELNNFLTTLQDLHANGFVDDADASVFFPSHTLEIDDTQGNKIKIEGAIQNNRKIIRSSQNPDNLLSGNALWDNVFAGKTKFIAVEESAKK